MIETGITGIVRSKSLTARENNTKCVGARSSFDRSLTINRVQDESNDKENRHEDGHCGSMSVPVLGRRVHAADVRQQTDEISGRNLIASISRPSVFIGNIAAQLRRLIVYKYVAMSFNMAIYGL